MSKLRTAILDDYQRAAFEYADWSSVEDELTVDVFTDTLHDEDALVARLEPYEIICAMRERTKFPASLLDRLPKLRLIATTGIRNLGIDTAHAKSKGIVVSGTLGGGLTIEHIWALLMATVRHIAIEHRNIQARKEPWQSVVPTSLSGKTLGLVGVGRFGIQVANIAKVFNMRVIGWSPNLTAERATEAGVEFCPSKEELMKISDVVSLQMVLSERSRNIVGAEELTLMKPTAYLINTSRGPLVNEEALIDVLQRKKIAGCGLDVFDVEPLPLDHPLRTLDNVTLSPHNAYVCDRDYKVFWGETVENIRAFLDGKSQRVL